MIHLEGCRCFYYNCDLIKDIHIISCPCHIEPELEELYKDPFLKKFDWKPTPEMISRFTSYEKYQWEQLSSKITPSTLIAYKKGLEINWDICSFITFKDAQIRKEKLRQRNKK
jgi:hypothetical protein